MQAVDVRFNHCACHFFQLLSSSPIRIPSSRLHQIRRVSVVCVCIFSEQNEKYCIILKYLHNGSFFPIEFFKY